MINTSTFDPASGKFCTDDHVAIEATETGYVPPPIKEAIETFRNDQPKPHVANNKQQPNKAPADRMSLITKFLQLDHLNPEQRTQLLKLVAQFADIFSIDKYDLGLTDAFTHKIFLTHDRPIYRKQFRIPDAHRTAIIDHVNNLLRLGVIQHSTSRYNSPVFCVPKKEGFRVVLDYL